MAHSNDYVVPHLDGLPYLDKPIVYFAAAAAMMELFGPTEAAARLPAYLATLATIALLVWFARRRWGEAAGWLAGLAYATMVLPLAYARTAIFDSTLTLCTTAAMLWFWDERPIAAWAAMAVGALTKGPIALAIPLFAIVPHALVTGAPVRRLFPWRALAVFGVIALPWFVAVSIKHPDFPGYVFLRETLERVTTRSFRRTAPFWYYLPILPLAAFPWIVPALARLTHWRATWDARRDPTARDPLLLASWVIVPLVFLSLNQSKLPQYVLPLMPAFALVAARNLTMGGSHTAARGYVGIAVVAGVALVALTGWLPAPISLTPAEKAAIPPTAVALGIVVLCSAVLVGVGAVARRPRLTLLGYGVVVMAIPFLSERLLVAVGEDRSSAPVANATAAALGHTGGVGTVLGVLAYPPSLPFYLGRHIAVATATGSELTSNYIADNHSRFRDYPTSPLLPEGYWREALARCPVPTVFLTGAGHREVRAALDAALPLLAADGRYAVYGPCQPHPLTPSPRTGEGERRPPSPRRGEGDGG
jgi:4-amino-4-deoxy-L-arabinose transferase-like glycosyltransferase